MSSIENLLSDFFAQDNGSSNLEKQAQVELFAKLASENGIDIEKLSADEFAQLWNGTFAGEPDTAAEKTAAEKAEAEKVAAQQAAETELAEKRAEAAKFAEAEALGRHMAHALTDEIRKIAGEMPEAFRKKIEEKKDEKGSDEKKKDEDKDEGKKLPEKKASAIDELAVELALKKVAEAGLSVKQAQARLGALMVLGVSDSEKIASASDVSAAVEIRSLELLEAAGYPVNWGK